LRTQSQRPKNEQVQCALWKVDALVRHCVTPFPSTKDKRSPVEVQEVAARNSSLSRWEHTPVHRSKQVIEEHRYCDNGHELDHFGCETQLL
jgi:hypothetical protein